MLLLLFHSAELRRDFLLSLKSADEGKEKSFIVDKLLDN